MRISRRGLLFSLTAAHSQWRLAAQVAGKGRRFPSVAARYLDPATEFQIVRLTDPHYRSYVPSAGNRVLSSRAMLFASDQTGSWEAFRMDLKNREYRQLTEAEDLDISSLAYGPNDKTFFHFDAGRLIETEITRLKSREIYRVPDGFQKMPGVSYSESGAVAAFTEKSDTGPARYRIRVLQLQKGTASTLIESPEEPRDLLLRPRHASLFYRIAGEPRLINIDGRQPRNIAFAEGENGQVQWTSEGNSLLYLNRPSTGRRLTSLREWNPETVTDSLIAETTQFIHFCPNSDASVFVGASGSKASPYVLLLARVARRELTLAEHRASDAAMVNPIFSPNSQFVVFVSDRHGKPAIYWINVDRFVSDTEGS